MALCPIFSGAYLLMELVREAEALGRPSQQRGRP